MTTISYTELQKNLEVILHKLATKHELIKVVQEDHELCILMSPEDFALLEKTKRLSKLKEEDVQQKPLKRKTRLKNLKPHHGIIGDPDELIDLKVYEWNEEKNL